MTNYEHWNIKGYDVEFLDDCHVYLVNGIIVPSVTTILKIKYGNKYTGISDDVLKRASALGTQMHSAIQSYEETGEECDLKELQNYKFLKKRYGWECIECEKPVILFENDEPIACGRVDMIAKIDGEIGGFDFKRTSVLDKGYLAYQLNMYRIAYLQSYGAEWKFLKGIHLRDEKRKFVDIPINEDIVWELINEYKEVTK